MKHQDNMLPAFDSSEFLDDDAIGVDIVDTLEGLSAIHQSGCAAAIWERRPLLRFQNWIDQLYPEQLPSVRVALRPDAVSDAVLHACDIAGAPDCLERAMLADDIAALAHRFAALMSAPYLRLRLDVVTGNACKRFHVDAVTARLLCTYRGAGTHYGVAAEGAQPQRIHTAPTGAPVVLRGSLWPNEPPRRVLHRSPPIAGSGETRLLLVLDPLDANELEENHVVH